MNHSISRLKKIAAQASVIRSSEAARDATLIRLAIAASFSKEAGGQFTQEIQNLLEPPKS